MVIRRDLSTNQRSSQIRAAIIKLLFSGASEKPRFGCLQFPLGGCPSVLNANELSREQIFVAIRSFFQRKERRAKRRTIEGDKIDRRISATGRANVPEPIDRAGGRDDEGCSAICESSFTLSKAFLISLATQMMQIFILSHIAAKLITCPSVCSSNTSLQITTPDHNRTGQACSEDTKTGQSNTPKGEEVTPRSRSEMIAGIGYVRKTLYEEKQDYAATNVLTGITSNRSSPC